MTRSSTTISINKPRLVITDDEFRTILDASILRTEHHQPLSWSSTLQQQIRYHVNRQSDSEKLTQQITTHPIPRLCTKIQQMNQVEGEGGLSP